MAIGDYTAVDFDDGTSTVSEVTFQPMENKIEEIDNNLRKEAITHSLMYC